jgi:soluble lytic murein transglycosylase-like protein
MTTYFTYSPLYQEAAAAEATAVPLVSAPAKNGSKGYQAPGGCAVSQAFPEAILQWCQLITAYAHRQRLSPDLIAALILQESGGNALAYSHSGAVGLMQVMPRDGLAASFQCPNGPCFASRPTIRELENPEFNVAFGTRFLAGLHERYGDMREALKAYGPRDVGYYYADKVLALWGRYGAE